VGGVAQGVEISDAPYVCWANNDLIFCEGWLEEILSILKNNDKIGVVSPNSNSLGVYPDQGLSLPDFAAGLRKKYSGVFVEMPFCVGFCLVVKREVIDKIGGLSADFAPGYFEDTDYSMAAKKAGYLIGFAKAAYVWHHEHVSFKQVKKKQEEAFSKNLDKFNRKWGRILRIACFADNYQEVFVSLAAGVELTRQGNYITFYVKDTDIRREEIFRACNLFENTGIQFKRSGNPIFVMVKIVFKKKRFDLIICRGFLKFFFRFMGYRVSDRFDQELAASIKSCVQ
ncbi:MAG: hypothetical protein NT088_00250, partial [Candidatus Omnitrophica bacterium]|nr:hypothetical protein [Candidatus Omnitrophota bacterium]